MNIHDPANPSIQTSISTQTIEVKSPSLLRALFKGRKVNVSDYKQADTKITALLVNNASEALQQAKEIKTLNTDIKAVYEDVNKDKLNRHDARTKIRHVVNKAFNKSVSESIQKEKQINRLTEQRQVAAIVTQIYKFNFKGAWKLTKELKKIRARVIDQEKIELLQQPKLADCQHIFHDLFNKQDDQHRLPKMMKKDF